MKKTLFTLSLFLMISICYCQEKIAEKYVVQVTYTGGGTENIEIKNDRHLNVPAPIVKDGSIFYDEEYLLLDVKKIKILKVDYSKTTPATKSKYVITKTKYWSDKYHRFINLNIISDPEAERAQAELNNKRSTIFDPDTTINNDKIKREVTYNSEKPTIEKDTIVVTTKQIVFENEGNGNFKRIENSGIKLVGDKIDSKNFNPEFDRMDIDKNSAEYLELSQLVKKKGMYLIEKQMNKEKQIVLCKIAAIHIEMD